MTEPERIAVIDVGSNSVRLVVYAGVKRAPMQFFNEKVVCGLGRSLSETGKLNFEGRTRAINAVRRFWGITQRMGVNEVHTVATAAVRIADDGEDFCKEVMLETGLKLRIVSGEEEGALSAKGILYCKPNAHGFVCDMGGSSMELAVIGGREVLKSRTSNLGPLRLSQFEDDPAKLAFEIERRLEDLSAGMAAQDTVYLIGGTIRAIASLHIAIKEYPLSLVNEYKLSGQVFKDFLNWLQSIPIEDIEATGIVSTDRIGYVQTVARVLESLLDRIDPKNVIFSSFGIREGVIYDNMPARIQKRDPLIEACQFFEQTDARFKDFGTTLYSWVLPLFPYATEQRKRLIWASCLLHDVSWKAHPDYRAEVSFDYATRSNLVGLNHLERVFLAVALIHRYKNKPRVSNLEALNILLSDEDQMQAEILGRAMRLGAMLGGPDVAHMGRLKLKGEILELAIDDHSAGLMGEVVDRRLNALGKSMMRDVVLRVE